MERRFSAERPGAALAKLVDERRGEPSHARLASLAAALGPRTEVTPAGVAVRLGYGATEAEVDDAAELVALATAQSGGYRGR